MMGHCGPAGMVTVDHTDREGDLCLCETVGKCVQWCKAAHIWVYMFTERESWHQASTIDFFGISSFLAFTMEKHKHSQKSL